MFDDTDDLSHEECLQLIEKGKQIGLEPFGEDWRKEMDMHPLFMDKIPQEVIDGELDRKKWPLLASHLDMMYGDDEDPEGNAQSYKDDGNREYKKGTKEGFHKAILSYSEGLAQGCNNNQLNAQLYCNRAAAQFSIGNYRRATHDSKKALELDPKYMKAISRGAMAQNKLGKRHNVVEWCDKGLAIDQQNKDLMNMKIKALQKLKEDERNERKRQTFELKERRKNQELLQALRDRKLNLYLPDEEQESELEREGRLLESLTCSSHGHVTLNEDHQLVWPVRLLYPGHSTSDVIQQFCETHSLLDHISYMFPPEGTSPEWDEEAEYTLQSIVAIYDSGDKKVELNKSDNLLNLLTKNNILISAGMPTFELYVRDSESYRSNVLGAT